MEALPFLERLKKPAGCGGGASIAARGLVRWTWNQLQEVLSDNSSVCPYRPSKRL